jgi:nucleoside-diphosphate-sugar epimerase
VRRLLAGGARVRVLARSPERARPLVEQGAEVVIGDITDDAAVASALEGAEIVYHLAGRLFIPGVPASVYRETHVVGTRLVLARCKERDGIRRFVHCSTTGVLGATGDMPANEDAVTRPGNAYEATKAEAEIEVRRAGQAGLPTVIVRPGLVYGPGDLHLLGFFRAILRRRFRPIGRRPVWLHPIFIDDMSEALIRCATYPSAVGECFNIAAPKPVLLTELAAAIAAAEGTHLPSGRIPIPAARAVAAAGDLLPRGMRQSAPLTRSRLDFLTHSRVYDVSKAQLVLGFRAAVDLPTGIARAVAWYRANGHLPVQALA